MQYFITEVKSAKYMNHNRR